MLNHKNIEVDVDVDPLATLNVKPGVLEILLANTIGNAFQHNDGGRVTIRLDGRHLAVSDRGGGMAPEVRDNVWDEYARGPSSVGFGRGLSIVRRVCEHHHVGLAVEHLERGTAILLDFPE